MGSTNRTVVIGGQDAGFGDLVENLKKQGEEMYKSFNEEASKHSKTLDDQHRRVSDLISQQRQKLGLLKEEQRLQAQMQLEERLNNAKGREDIFNAKESHKAALDDINKEHQRSSFVAGTAGGMNQGGGGGSSGGGGSRGGSRSGGRARGAAGFGGRLAMAGVAGMGGGLLGGGLFGIINSMFREGAELETAQAQVHGMTGQGYGSPGLGLKSADAAKYATTIAGQRGMRGGATGQLQTEKAFGMGFGSLGFMNQFARQGSDDTSTLTRKLLSMATESKIWGVEKGDFSALNEKLGQMSELMSEEKQHRESGISGARASAMLGAFSGLGGGFADDRAGARIGSMGEMIKGGGGNDFAKAEIMSALIGGSKGRGEELDLLGVRSRMAKGAMGENNISDVMGHFQKRFGKGSRQLQSALGIMMPNLMGNDEALSNLSNMDVESFSEEGLEGMMGRMSGGPNIGARAGAHTGVVESNKARLADSMARAGIKSINALSGIVDKLIDGFDMMPKLIDGMIDSFVVAKEAVGDFADDVSGAMDKFFGSNYENAGGSGSRYTHSGTNMVGTEFRSGAKFNFEGKEYNLHDVNSEFAKTITQEEKRKIAEHAKGGGYKSESGGTYTLSLEQTTAATGRSSSDIKNLGDVMNGLKTAIEKNTKSQGKSGSGGAFGKNWGKTGK